MSTSMSTSFVMNYFKSVNQYEGMSLCLYIVLGTLLPCLWQINIPIGKVQCSWHLWSNTWFIQIPCPILAFPVSYQMHAHWRTSVWLCASSCLVHFRERERESRAKTESEGWLHFNRKTNREGASVAAGVTVTGDTARQRERDTESKMKTGGCW